MSLTQEQIFIKEGFERVREELDKRPPAITSTAALTTYAGLRTNYSVDGFAFPFIFDPTSTQQADGVYCVLGKGGTNPLYSNGALTTAAVPGRWINTSFNINIREYGAVGKGDTNDRPAIQKAVDFCRRLYLTNGGQLRRPILVPDGFFRINTCVDATDCPGIYFIGEGGGYVTSTIVGNTGGLMIDFSGSTRSGAKDLFFTSQNEDTNPSSRGLQFALNKDAEGKQKGGLNCSLNNVSIFLADLTQANNGLGSIPLINCRSEEFRATDLFIRGNLPVLFTNRIDLQSTTGFNYTITSDFTPLQDDAIGSMGVIKLEGSLQAWERLSPCMLMNGVNTLSFHGYMGRAHITPELGLSYENAMVFCQYTHTIKVHATIESYSTTAYFRHSYHNCTIEATVANQTDPTRPVFIMDRYSHCKGTSKLGVGFGNPAEGHNRMLLHAEPVPTPNSAVVGDLPIEATIMGLELTSGDFTDNTKVISPHLLRKTANSIFNVAIPFEKKGSAVRKLGNYHKSLGLYSQANNVATTIMRFNLADKFTKTVGNGGYYQAVVEGVIQLGNYNTNGSGSCAFRSTILMNQNSNGTRQPYDSTTEILARCLTNPALLTINEIEGIIEVIDGVGHIRLLVDMTGSGVNEELRFEGDVALTTSF